MKYSNLVLIFGLVFLAATQWSCEAELFGGCTSGEGSIETVYVMENGILVSMDVFAVLEEMNWKSLQQLLV